MTGCRDSNPPLTAVLTLKDDGSHFSGTVIRREPASITISSSSGETRTFLYTELSDIKYGTPGNNTPAGGSAAVTGTSAQTAEHSGSAANPGAPVAGRDVIELPAGTVVQVTNVGLIDSSFVPVDAFALAAIDTDVKSPDGRVLVPAGANATIKVRQEGVVGGRMEMQFELGTLDFNNRHYLVLSAKGASEPGTVVTFQGAPSGSPEERLRGKNVHLDDHSLMVFRAETPTIIKVSQ